MLVFRVIRSMDVEKCKHCCRTVKKTYLKRHIASIHPDQIEESKRCRIECCVCHKKFRLLRLLRHHINETHKKLSEEIRRMESMDEFKQWLQSEELRLQIHFFTSRLANVRSNGSKIYYYYCQYNNTGQNTVLPPQQRKRALRCQGSYKLSGSCPAGMKVEETPKGKVFIRYYKTHLGHGASLAHFLLSKEERQKIAEKLKTGVCDDRTVNDKHFERVVKLAKISDPRSKQQIYATHRKGVAINDADVKVRTENGETWYRVTSRMKKHQVHEVMKTHDPCPPDCHVICPVCEVCVHTYSCTCIERKIKRQICKHIHKVCNTFKIDKNVPLPRTASCAGEKADKELDDVVASCATKKADEELNVVASCSAEKADEELDVVVVDFIDTSSTIDIPEASNVECLKNKIGHLSSLLESNCSIDDCHFVEELVDLCIARLTNTPTYKTLKEKKHETATSNEKIQPQRNFHFTKQKSLNICELSLAKPTNSLKKQMNLLLQGIDTEIEIRTSNTSSEFNHLYSM